MSSQKELHKRKKEKLYGGHIRGGEGEKKLGKVP